MTAFAEAALPAAELPGAAGTAAATGLDPGLSRTALVCGPTIPSAGTMSWLSWKVMRACFVSGPKMPSTGMSVPLSALSSVCNWLIQPP